ncbi:hypothetical protein [Clostridium sp.]|uniref:hypothetical protein n=1 Tax=Clostridium sp. TaxID=1506 RepID=UPI0034647374
MQTTSTDYKLEIKKPSRSFECKVTIGNNIYTNDDIVDIILETIQPGEGFSIGNTPSQTLDLTLLNRGDIIYSTSQVKVEIGLKIGSTIEYVLMGLFNIDDIEKTDYTTKITAYDNMIKFETPYFSSLGDTPTLTQVVNELATKTGVQFIGSLPAYTVKKLEGFTCREILGYVSSLCGGNALITRDGKFTIVNSKELTYFITADNYIDYKREEVKYKIGKVSCKVGDKELNKGSLGIDSMEVKFENPWVTDSILNGIYTKLNGFEYLGYTMKWQGDISLDVGDVITCTDVKGVVRKIPILSQKFTYNGGLTAEIGAKGETKNKNSFNSSGSGSNKIDRVVTDLLIVNKALIDKANIQQLEAVSIRTQKLEAKTAAIEVAIIDVAHISDLTAINANIEKLIAADATIGQAIIGKANITDLTASVGRIEILESSVGDIKTLVNGNLTSNNIQSLILSSDKVTVVNGFIKNAMIENLDVSKILAGDISTNKFRIKSDNGGIEIVGATQQFKDKNNRVRIQMGQDTQGNFNFILRGEDGTTTLIDHNGIKEKAIRDDLIKSNMISENAVGGKQIDYNSFTSEFNKDTNTHTLKSSKVLLDKDNQTLDVAFNTLSSTVDGIEIGARNLIPNSGCFKEVGDWNKYSTVTIVDKDNFKVLANSATIATPNLNILEPNTEYICTAEFMLSVDYNATYTTPNHIYVKKVSDNTNASVITQIVDGNRLLKANTWEKVIIKFKTMDTTEKLYFKFHLYTGSTPCAKWLKNVKLEKGNKATDWTPAPEDTDQAINNVKEITTSNTTAINVQQGKIDTLISNTTIIKDGKTIQLKDSYNSTVATVDSINSTIGKHTSTIDALSGQITGVDTKVNTVQRDLNGTISTISGHTTSINGLNSTVNTQSSSISQLQNSIKLKVEETQVNNIVNGAVDRIEVGGRNLLLGSSFFDDAKGWSRSSSVKIVSDITVNGNNSAKISLNGLTTNAYTNISLNDIDTSLFVEGEIYTYSLWAYTPDTNSIDGRYEVGLVMFKDGEATEWNSTEIPFVNGKWVKATKTFTMRKGFTKLSFRMNVVKNGTIYYSSPKVEKGNKATDWTPAPEDTQEQITSVSKRTATIETNLTGITSRVSSVEQTTSTIGGNVTSLQTRMSTAEQKITDSAIISTVSNTFLNKEDATKTYATKASMTLTESQLRLDFSASGGYNYYLRKCYTARLTGTATIYQDSVDGFDERCKGTRIVAPALFESRFQKVIPKNGTYSISFYAKANNGNYPTVQVQLCDKVAGEVYVTNVWKLFKIENVTISNWSDIYSFMDIRVNSNYYWDFTLSHICINDGPVALPWSPNATEIYSGNTVIDAKGVTIYNGAIDVRNNAGTSVLKGDSNGNLMVRGNLYADPANPILHLFENCSLDATYNNEQGIGSAVRLKWNASNYLYVATNDVSIFQNGNRYYEFTPGYFSIVPSTTYFANQCKIDVSGGTFRFYVSKTIDTGIRVSPDGTIAFLVNGTSRHVFYPGGTKAGGTIEVDGVNLGMSPIDSPQVLLESVLFDIDVREEGTTVSMDSTFLRTISTYAVFCSNHNVTIVSKDRTSFYVQGYTGKVDFRIIGYRIGFEEQYYQVVS